MARIQRAMRHIGKAARIGSKVAGAVGTVAKFIPHPAAQAISKGAAVVSAGLGAASKMIEN